MPSKSKAQQRFMGMVHAYNKGDMPDAPASVKKAAKDMKKSDVKKYAATKHKGKPEKVTERKFHHKKKGDDYMGGFNSSKGDTEMFADRKGRYYIWVKPKGKKERYIDLPTNIKDRGKADSFHNKIKKKLISWTLDEKQIQELVPNMWVVNNKAYQALLNKKIGDVKVATALSNKKHTKHKQAKSMIDRLKDKIKTVLSKKKASQPKKQSKSNADFYKKQFTGEQVDMVKEYIQNRIPELVREAKDNFDVKKMKKLLKKDRFLQMAYKTIKGKNEEEKLSRLYFNLVFKDKKYEPKYKKV